MTQGYDFVVGSVRIYLGDRTGDGSGGPEIRVYGPTVSGEPERQLLRFDCFRVEPHYHYDPAGVDEKVDMEGDAAADPVSWSLDQLRTRLPEMVCRAGGNPEAAADCDSLAARDAISVIAQKLGRA